MKLFLPYRTTNKIETFEIDYAGKSYDLTIPKGFKYRPSLPKFLLKMIGISDGAAYKIAKIHDYLFETKKYGFLWSDGWAFKESLNYLPFWKILLLQPIRIISLFYWIT